MRVQAFADVEQAPLVPAREAELREWFQGWFDGRLKPYLAPRDHAALQALFDPEQPGYLLADPAFFLARYWFLVTGYPSGG